jgi:hypothetical protein
MNPLSRQIGGDHYQHFVIQPVKFITKNDLGFLEGCVVERLCRYNKPGGKGLEDLEKCKHEIELLISMRYQTMTDDLKLEMEKGNVE